MHVVLTEARHDRWFDDGGFLFVENQIPQPAKAHEGAHHRITEPTPGNIVSSLTISFWTSMLAPACEDMWQTTLNRIARQEDGRGRPRKDLSGPLTPIRTLRNRIVHHEPILHWNLDKHYANILQITGWLSPAAAS